MPDFVCPSDVVLHYDYAPGEAGQPAIVFANARGTNLRIWDDLGRRLDPAIPTLVMDKRGHELSRDGPTSSAAIRDADLTGPTSGLKAPTFCVAGIGDDATPPDLLRGLSRLIDGTEYRCLDGVGHLPCIEAPDRLAAMLADLHGEL